MRLSVSVWNAIRMQEFGNKVRQRHVELAQKILDFAIERGMPRGGRLTEQVLASHCNVSRTPIRKALQLLAEREVVCPEPEGGYQLAIEPASFPGLGEQALPAEETELYNSILRDISAGTPRPSRACSGAMAPPAIRYRTPLSGWRKKTSPSGRQDSNG